jgi:DNA-binding SARP family transcriptional activator
MTEGEAAQAVVTSARSRIALRTIGSFCIEVDGRDQTRRLRDQPRLEFLISYLVARSLRAPNLAVERAAIAEEMAPRIDPTIQRDRLRKTLHAFQIALGSDLKSLVRVTATHVRFDMTGIDVDFVALAEMASRVSRRKSLIDTSLADDVRRLLDTTTGEFLGGFSDLEHQVTGGGGIAHQVVEEARLQIGGWRADLTAALARHLEAAGRPQSSIAYLQSALAQSPQREDLARLLVASYMQTGQTARAEETRLEYGLSSGEAR